VSNQITEQEMRAAELEKDESRYEIWGRDIAQACEYNPKKVCMVFLMALEVVNAHSLRRQLTPIIQCWLNR